MAASQSSGAARAPCNEGEGPRTFRSDAEPVPRLSRPTWVWHPEPGKQMPCPRCKQKRAGGCAWPCLQALCSSLEQLRGLFSAPSSSICSVLLPLCCV